MIDSGPQHQEAATKQAQPPRSSYDTDRLAGLRRARRRATALLVAVVAVFASTFAMGDAAWVGFLRTTAEAALVGGLADWFAVTALFRHPLGIPIPHTAIIPRSKDGLGRNLGEFVRHNFLAPDQLEERIGESRPALRLGRWLSDPTRADAVAARLAAALGGLAEGLGREAIEGEVEQFVLERIRALPTAELLGRGMEVAIAGGHHQPVVTSAISGLLAALDDNRLMLRRRLGEESPWWVPDALDDAVFDRAHAALGRFLIEVAAEPDHEVRRMIDQRLTTLAGRLRTDPALASAVAERVEALASHPEVRAWARATWSRIAGELVDAAERSDSRLRRQLAAGLEEMGSRLADDTRLQDRLDTWARSVAPPLARLGRREIGDLISVTVDRWDPAEMSHRLELWMGRDLQFVRINGTVVGGLAGLAIHTVVVIIGG